MPEWERRPFDFEAVEWLREHERPPPYVPPPAPVVEPPAPGRWFFPRRPPSRWLLPSLLGVALGPALALAGNVLASPLLMLLGIVVFFAACLWVSRLVRDPHRPRRKGGFLLEDPDDLNVCLVDVRIVDGYVTHGRDQGAAWFEDGRLFFAGLRTSFVLGGEDVLPKAGWKTFDNPEYGSTLPSNGVPLNARAKTYVAFSPVPHADRAAFVSQELRFLRRLAEFRNDPPRSKGPRQLPPLSP